MGRDLLVPSNAVGTQKFSFAIELRLPRSASYLVTVRVPSVCIVLSQVVVAMCFSLRGRFRTESPAGRCPGGGERAEPDSGRLRERFRGVGTDQAGDGAGDIADRSGMETSLKYSSI
ncbi:hypothetical protein [Nocardia sp. NPDC003963]